uniref:Uncharacterized protein n=1 Tax=Arundo donax TaxID=35708 RepID=A0A0A9EBB7_ARUDO
MESTVKQFRRSELLRSHMSTLHMLFCEDCFVRRLHILVQVIWHVICCLCT